MNDTQYLQYCQQLFGDFAETLHQRTKSLSADDALRELAVAFAQLAQANGDFYVDGPVLVARLFTTYPDFAPTFPRELLWFLGGDCLHFMPDQEIQLYRQLEDLRLTAAADGDPFDLPAVRAKLLKLQ